ncbi:MAG: hypothetical protein ACU0DI_06025 [Paracoccaceae bacterium]
MNPTVLRSWIFSLAISITTLMLTELAEAASWTEWEIKNSVARERDWLVIKAPGENFCFLQQSYDDDLSKMQLTIEKGKPPYVVTSFFYGVEGTITYRVDENAPRSFDASTLARKNAFYLSIDTWPEMKKGNRLFVSVKPVNKNRRSQAFSLIGLTAASQWFENARCK